MIENGQYDDFEFKPLTEGLGFHKKKVSFDTPIQLSEDKHRKSIKTEADNFLKISSSESLAYTNELKSYSQSVSSQTPVLETKTRKPGISEEINIDKVRSEFKKKAALSKTLPRDDVFTNSEALIEKIEAKNEIESVSTSASDLKNDYRLDQKVDFLEEESLSLRAIPTNIAASIIDSIVVFGICNLLISGLIVATNIDVFDLILTSYKELDVQLGIASLLLCTIFMYMTVSRAITGQTIGDWAMDVRLGTLEQESKWLSYIIKSSVRSLISIMTGIVVLPFFSLIIRRDILGFLSGLKLMKVE